MVYNIETYEPAPGESFLFDTNVWIYLYSPVVRYNYHIVEVFGRFLNKCIDNGANIYITSMILSEFYNTAIKIAYKTSNTEMFKKDFRKKQTYGSSVISMMGKCIIPKTIRIEDCFGDIDFSGFNGTYDFNDYYITQLCKLNGIKIVTNDSDFKDLANQGVDVITLDSNYVSSKSVVKMDLA